MKEETRPHHPAEPGELAARMRAARAYAGMTRTELAEAINRSKSTVERMEKGDAAALGLGQTRSRRLIEEVAAATGMDEGMFYRDWWREPAQSDAEVDRVSEIDRRLGRIERAVAGLSETDAENLKVSIADLLREADPPDRHTRPADDSPAEGGSRGR